MTPALRITVIVLCVLFLVVAVKQIMSGKLQLRYSLIWFGFVLVIVIGALYPAPLFAVANLLGFRASSNFLLLVGLLFAFAISLALTTTVSKQMRYITNLVQENALLRHRLEELEERFS